MNRKSMIRTQRFGLVFTEQEYEALKLLADYDGGLSLAAEIRLAIRRRARELDLWPAPEVKGMHK